jgi:hypothetical protein
MQPGDADTMLKLQCARYRQQEEEQTIATFRAGSAPEARTGSRVAALTTMRRTGKCVGRSSG